MMAHDAGFQLHQAPADTEFLYMPDKDQTHSASYTLKCCSFKRAKVQTQQRSAVKLKPDLSLASTGQTSSWYGLPFVGKLSLTVKLTHQKRRQITCWSRCIGLGGK